jgi:hypothetical protein
MKIIIFITILISISTTTFANCSKYDWEDAQKYTQEAINYYKDLFLKINKLCIEDPKAGLVTTKNISKHIQEIDYLKDHYRYMQRKFRIARDAWYNLYQNCDGKDSSRAYDRYSKSKSDASKSTKLLENINSCYDYFIDDVSLQIIKKSYWEDVVAKHKVTQREYTKKFERFKALVNQFSHYVHGDVLSKAHEIKSAYSDVVSAGGNMEILIANWRSISRDDKNSTNRKNALENAKKLELSHNTNSEMVERIKNRFEEQFEDVEFQYGPFYPVVLLNDGNRYMGALEKFLPHGKGKLHKKNGEIIAGEWRQGKLWDIDYICRCSNECSDFWCDPPPELMYERRAVISPVANIYDTFRAREIDLSYQAEKYYPVIVLYEYKSLYKIKDFEDDKGWVLKSDVEDIQTVVVKSDHCKAYTGPSFRTVTLFSVGKGVSFKVLKREGNWIHVEHSDGDSGWIEERFLW